MGTNKALFLDRDGVINIERGYLHRREEFEFLDGIFDLCTAAQARGYRLLVVTNQAGIARGYYTEDDFLNLTEWMLGEFRLRQINIDKVYYCPFHPLEGIGRYKVDSADRKPKPGMLLRAQREFDLDLASSILVGDQRSDIEAAFAAGVGTKIWLKARTPQDPVTPTHFHVVESIHDVRNLLSQPQPPAPEVTNELFRNTDSLRSHQSGS